MLKNGDKPRVSPESLLQLAEKEARGRLKVFFGAAPGVGKTYAMLQAGHRRKAEGVDVVIGLIETHGRAETQALLDGLEILPRKPVSYNNRALMEFDIDEAMKRRPELILIDELAHSNAKGSRHPKRWQDVEELLRAGVDVYTTVNIQHLESVNDIIARITGVRVRETLPDHVIERADEITLIDLTPEELRQRLSEGKVYVPQYARRAMDNFFKASNLTALRELALRRTAEQVNDQLVEQMQLSAIEGPWPAGERILVCIGPDTFGSMLVRYAKRRAQQIDAPFVAMHVEYPEQHLTPQEHAFIDEAFELALSLGGSIERLVGNDLPQAIIAYARHNNITQILIRRSKSSWWAELMRRSLVHELVRHADNIAVHIITDHGSIPSLDQTQSPNYLKQSLRDYALALALVGMAGLIAAQLYSLSPLPNLSLLFLVPVLLSATWLGRWPSILASVVGFLTYNFFFVEPRFTFVVSDGHDFLALITFLLVAILVANLSGRIKDQARAALQRVQELHAIYGFTRKLSAATDQDGLVHSITEYIATTVQGKAVLLVPTGGELVLKFSHPVGINLDAGNFAAAHWAWTHHEDAGWGTGTLPTSSYQFRPLKSPSGCVAVIGFEPQERHSVRAFNLNRSLDALLDQSAIALERSELMEEIILTKASTETEKLRNALLSSISHDLRTPLSSILGSVTSLIEYGKSFTEETRYDLLLNIREESERLNRFIANLLDLTKLESGNLQVKTDWIDVGDVIQTAIKRMEPSLGGRNLEKTISLNLPRLKLDAILLEQVFVNLIDNAIRYTPPDTVILITVIARDQRVEINVIDHGPGIPQKALPHIFERFFRVASPEIYIEGTGLGLAICKGIVETLGGTIEARSPVMSGHGTAIVITFQIKEEQS